MSVMFHPSLPRRAPQMRPLFSLGPLPPVRPHVHYSWCACVPEAGSVGTTQAQCLPETGQRGIDFDDHFMYVAVQCTFMQHCNKPNRIPWQR